MCSLIWVQCSVLLGKVSTFGQDNHKRRNSCVANTDLQGYPQNFCVRTFQALITSPEGDVTHLLTSAIEALIHLGWKRPVGFLSPTVNLAQQGPLLNHVTKHYTYTSFEYPYISQPLPWAVLFQCLTTYLVNKFFLLSGVKIPQYNLMPFFLVTSLLSLEKRSTTTLL